VGYQAGYSNTTGAVTALGYQAGYGNQGGDITAVGVSAMVGNTSGTNNTGIGKNVLYSNSTGSTNTGVGYNAGYFITTGSKNTVIGSFNGNQNNLDIRTASNYIVLSDGDGNARATYNATGVGFYTQPGAPTKTSAATLTGAEVLTQIVTTTGTGAFNLTMPSGPTLDTATGGMPTDTCFDFTVINVNSAGTVTIVVNGTNFLAIGSLSVPVNTSASYKIRKTGVNSFLMYRL
jgi:hypothetical protein